MKITHGCEVLIADLYKAVLFLRYILESITMSRTYTARVKCWVDEVNGTFLGAGRITLLERIKSTGSINRAALELKMSYRQAWQLVQEMNQRARQPLVVLKTGGKYGGGSAVTAAGMEAIRKFHQLEKMITDYAIKQSALLDF